MAETYPYPPRPGTANELDGLDVADSRRLSESALEDVLDFERQLYGASLHPQLFPAAEAYKAEQAAAGHPIQPFETVWKPKSNAAELGISYFLTDKGRAAYAEISGAQLEARSIEACRQELARLDIRKLDSKTIDKLRADSIGHMEASLTEAFIDGGFDGAAIGNLDVITLYKRPEVLAQKARGYRQLRAYVRLALQDLKAVSAETDDESVDAKIELADAYRKRLNDFIATAYVDAQKFLYLHRQAGDERGDEVASELHAALPALFEWDDDEDTSYFLQRMDRYKNGVSVDGDGKFTWLSPEAKALALQARHGADGGTVDRGIYDDIDPEELARTEIDAETFKQWLSGVLRHYDLLSGHEEWNSERKEPPPDGKWQVIVDDSFKSLSINDKQRIVKVPKKNISILDAVVLGNHELTHVVQHENKRRVGRLAILERIGIDNNSGHQESGGKWQEREARELLTGKVDTGVDGTSYMKAMEVKAAGGTFGDCIQAYYDDLRIREPDVSPEETAAEAVNRARRLYRSGGAEYTQNLPFLSDTRALNYLEQRLIYQSLDEERRRLLFIGGVTMRNLVVLSRLGILNPDAAFIPEKLPWELMYPNVKAALAASKN